jgi:hypothetical protein
MQEPWSAVVSTLARNSCRIGLWLGDEGLIDCMGELSRKPYENPESTGSAGSQASCGFFISIKKPDLQCVSAWSLSRLS